MILRSLIWYEFTRYFLGIHSEWCYVPLPQRSRIQASKQQGGNPLGRPWFHHSLRHRLPSPMWTLVASGQRLAQPVDCLELLAGWMSIWLTNVVQFSKNEAELLDVLIRPNANLTAFELCLNNDFSNRSSILSGALSLSGLRVLSSNEAKVEINDIDDRPFWVLDRCQNQD
jgi:hypothetical protein